MRSGSGLGVVESESADNRRPRRRMRVWLLVGSLLIAGIAGAFIWGSLQARPEGFDPNANSTAQPVGEVTTVVAEQGPTRFTVDARSTEDWVLFDFVSGQVVESDFSSTDWDLAFRRTKLLTNSGVTNPGGPGGAFDLGEVALEEAVPPPSAEFSVDILGGDDGDEPENPAAGKWYTYSFITHIVGVKPDTYLIRTGEEQDALVQFDSYYCENEDSGCVTFRYRLVPAVSG